MRMRIIPRNIGIIATEKADELLKNQSKKYLEVMPPFMIKESSQRTTSRSASKGASRLIFSKSTAHLTKSDPKSTKTMNLSNSGVFERPKSVSKIHKIANKFAAEYNRLADKEDPKEKKADKFGCTLGLKIEGNDQSRNVCSRQGMSNSTQYGMKRAFTSRNYGYFGGWGGIETPFLSTMNRGSKRLPSPNSNYHSPKLNQTIINVSLSHSILTKSTKLLTAAEIK